MGGLRFTMSLSYRKAVERPLQTAQHLGTLRQVKYGLAILAGLDGQSVAQVALILRVPEQTSAAWGCAFCCYGLQGAPHTQPTGRPPPWPPPQKEARATLMEAGPVQAGCSGACWRSPMLQPLISDRCGVYDHRCYLAQWRTNCGCSSQKAAGVSEHRHAQKRHEWRPPTWPQLLRRATERQALRLWGDAAALPPWGTLPSTWARRGQQPQGKTSGKRKGSQVCGLMEDLTGPLFSQGQAGRRNAATDMAFLTRVLARTTQGIILIQDGAQYHTSTETQAVCAQEAARLQGVQLPTYAPDDNPSEQLWKKLKQQETHLHSFPTFEALPDQVEQALLTFANIPADILALCSLPTA